MFAFDGDKYNNAPFYVCGLFITVHFAGSIPTIIIRIYASYWRKKKNDGRRTAVSSGIAHAIPFAHTRYNTTYIYLYKNDVHNADDDDGGGW